MGYLTLNLAVWNSPSLIRFSHVLVNTISTLIPDPLFCCSCQNLSSTQSSILACNCSTRSPTTPHKFPTRPTSSINMLQLFLCWFIVCLPTDTVPAPCPIISVYNGLNL